MTRILLFFILILVGVSFNQMVLNLDQLFDEAHWASLGDHSPFIYAFSILGVAAMHAVVFYKIGSLRNIAKTQFFIVFTLFAFGCGIFTSLIEALFFGQALEFTLSDFFMGLLFSIPGYTLMAWATTIMPRVQASTLEDNKTPLSISRLLISVPIITVLYIVVYFMAGAFIALQFPQIVEFYGDTIPPISLILSVQVFRGALWALLAYALIMIISGKRLHKAIIVGTAFVVLHATPLLIANEFMPWPVRFGHLVEVSISLFIFGTLTGWILMPKKRADDQASSKKLASP